MQSPQAHSPEISAAIPLSLCAGTAQALENALWCADSAQRAELLRPVLWIDPGFAFQCAVEWTPDRAEQSPTIDTLADHLSKSLAGLLQGLGQGGDVSGRASPAAKNIAIKAVVLAKLTGRLATAHGHPEQHASKLAALLWAGADVLRSQDNPNTQAAHTLENTVKLLWKRIALPDISSFWEEAYAMWDGRNAAETPSPLVAGLEELEADAQRHWEIADAEAHAALARLAARLAPLEANENHFSARLEEEKLAALKELAYGAGHEINNPLANISVRAQTLLKQERDPERRRMLAAIHGQVFRAHEMIADLMLFAQPPKITPQRVNLAELIQQAAEELQTEAAARATELICSSVEYATPASVDPVQIGVALRAMCLNALEAVGHGGHIELGVRLRCGAGGREWAEILVDDDGPGISPEVRRHLFDPFYSGREAGRGLGFGLSKCWRIVQEHGGRIDVESAPGRGARFIIRLPAA